MGRRSPGRLKPDANKALQQLVKLLQVNTETEAVETAIMALRDVLKASKAPAGAKQQRVNAVSLRLVK